MLGEDLDSCNATASVEKCHMHPTAVKAADDLGCWLLQTKPSCGRLGMCIPGVLVRSIKTGGPRGLDCGGVRKHKVTTSQRKLQRGRKKLIP